MMMMLEKRDAVDSGIVEAEGSWALGRDERKLDAFTRGSRALFTKDMLDATQDQSLGGATFVRGAGFETLAE